MVLLLPPLRDAYAWAALLGHIPGELLRWMSLPAPNLLGVGVCCGIECLRDRGQLLGSCLWLDADMANLPESAQRPSGTVASTSWKPMVFRACKSSNGYNRSAELTVATHMMVTAGYPRAAFVEMATTYERSPANRLPRSGNRMHTTSCKHYTRSMAASSG